MDPEWTPSKVSDSDTDAEVTRCLLDFDFDPCQQVDFTKKASSNRYIVEALKRSRKRWALLFISLWQRMNNRRSKVLALIYQQRRLAAINAVEGIVMRRLCWLLRSRLQPKLQLYVASEFLL